MHIGITGPVSIAPFAHLLPPGCNPPPTYSFPLVGKLVRALAERGNRVSVFAASTEICSPWKVSGDAVTLTVIPLRKRRAAYDFYRRERNLLGAEMRAADCDLIHAHWTYEFAAAALETSTPCLVTAHDSPFAILRYFVCTRYFPFWAAKVLLGVYVARKASHLTTVSPYCQESLQQTLRPKASITLIANGIDEDIIMLGKARLRTGQPNGDFCIATIIQGFQSFKNSKNALRAFSLFRNTYPQARLIMFGTGFGGGEEAQNWAKCNDLDSGVEFAGKTSQEEMFQRLKDEVHILLHPAREESFGMAPLEAMALGIPVIGGRKSGGVPFVLDDGRAGLLVDVERPAEIAGSLLKLAKDPNLSSHLAATGHHRAATVFPINRMVDAYEAEYQKILS